MPPEMSSETAIISIAISRTPLMATAVTVSDLKLHLGDAGLKVAQIE